MDFSLETNMYNKILLNKYEFLDIEKHSDFYDFFIYYLEKNLVYIKISSSNIKKWDEDIKIRIYDNDNIKFEDVSIGSSDNFYKEMEIYLDIELFYKTEKINKNIQKKVLLNKDHSQDNKSNFYDMKYFLYLNNSYSVENDLSFIDSFFENNYIIVKILLNYILNDNIKLIIKVLFYLNKNGGIFINKNCKNLSIDNLNIDHNCCFLDDKIITIIFTKINFLNEDLLISDLKNKKEIIFDKYLNNFDIINDNSIVNDLNLNFKNNYYNNIITIEEYTFYICSDSSEKDIIEKLPNNYYCLNSSTSEENINIDIYDDKKKFNFKLGKDHIRNKFQNNYIFKL